MADDLQRALIQIWMMQEYLGDRGIFGDYSDWLLVNAKRLVAEYLEAAHAEMLPAGRGDG